MQIQPPITLTRPDADRLTTLLAQDHGHAHALLLERLGDELDRAQVVAAGGAPGLVTLGSRVAYRNLETGQQREVVLVLPEDARPGRPYLSVLTPIGCSLIGLREGDTFSWDDGPRSWRLQVLSVQRD